LQYVKIPIPTTAAISIAPRLDIGHFVAQGRSRDPPPDSLPTAVLLMEPETTKKRSGLFFPLSF
jgi:hypothetical protein